MIQVAGWHQIDDKAALSRALGVVVTRIPHDQVRIALVADAREWICGSETCAGNTSQRGKTISDCLATH